MCSTTTTTRRRHDDDDDDESMLPEALLCLLCATLSLAQPRTTLAVNAVASFALRQSTFSLPPNPELSVSVAVCSDSTPAPRFFVSNTSNSDNEATPTSAGGSNVFEIPLISGQGNWTGSFTNGGLIAVDLNGASGVSFQTFEIGVSDNLPLHRTLTDLPFLGDTTSNQALLFSPPFLSIDVPVPTYPNYTLPPANMSQPDAPSTNPNFTLKIFPTSAGFGSKPQTACFLQSQKSEGTIANETQWARDLSGWRTQWLLGGLTPATNYTAFVVQSTNVSGPIYFSTKSAAFNCPLVHSLPYCPSVAYAAPLPSPPRGALGYDAENMPEGVTTPLLSYMANFTTMLTTFACGRDWYSPIMGCNDCQREYRAWLCSISFTRCTEPSPSNPDGFTAVPAQPSGTGLAASRQSGGAQQVLSAILPQATSDTPRNPFLPPLGAPYRALLPCIEQCNRVDRACPPFLGFKCPTNDFNGGASYGMGYIDSADGDRDGGVTGAAQDRFGNVWCNLI